VSFGALGGAFSIDHYARTNGLDWWAGLEETQQDDLDLLGDAPLDVLVTHDAPFGAEPAHGSEIGSIDEMRASRTRRLLADAVAATQPRLVLHGHWHLRNKVNLMFDEPRDPQRRWATVHGLASDIEDSAQSWATLDLATLKFRDGNAVSGVR
jgi:hypothetical protein